MAKDNNILIEQIGFTKKIILNKPEKRNSLDENMISEIKNYFEEFSNDLETKTIVLCGKGGNFSTGFSLEYINKISKYDAIENKKDSDNYKELLLSIYNCRKPVIAMVEGYALAAGCCIASACDLIIASNKAQFGFTEVKIGFVPSISIIFLLKRISESNVKDLILTSRFITAIDAHKIGLVNYVIEENMLNAYVENICREINQSSFSSLLFAKEIIRNAVNMSFESALSYAADMNVIVRMTEDCKKGMMRFLTKDFSPSTKKKKN